ncbi:MAG: hypothetical protein RLZZ584_3935, partial [Pseudomonadota bacterium]
MATAAPFTASTRAAADGEFATRVRALDFSAFGLVLPNPDPILKERGIDISTYRTIARDSHVGACIRRRKAAVKAMQWGLDRAQAPARVHKAVQDALAALDLERIIGQALEAVLFGYQPLEITWRGQPGGVLPADVQAKPPEWFCFDPDNRLRLKTKAVPLEGELLPERKFLLPRQDPTYQNPYGQPDLALCYWPVIFMKGGKRFWLTFAEKFGSAFALGKLPRGSQPAEVAAMLAGLEGLIQDGVGTIPDDGSVELIESAGKSASADLYERLVLHCRSEISIVLTGTNQTMEASSNKASASAGLDVAEDLRDADAEVVAAAVNQLIRWMVDINWPGSAAPVFSLWDQQARDDLQAQRDKSNHDAGARFSNAYFMRAYGYQEGDLLPEAGPGQGPGPGQLAGPVGKASSAGAAFAEAALAQARGAAEADPTTAELQQLGAAAAPAWATLGAQVQALVDRAANFAELQDALTHAYGSLDSADLVKLMAAAFALAELKGLDDARTQA